MTMLEAVGIRNRKWVFHRPSVGELREGDLKFEEAEVAPLSEGRFLLKNRLLSLDPTNRVWMGSGDNYMQALKRGEVMRGLSIGEVVESRNSRFPVGKMVYGLLGWQEYHISDGTDIIKEIPDYDIPEEAHFGLLLHIGLAAYYGLFGIGDLQGGETVVVSAAAGAVGSLACQLARNKGCKVIGIAGGEEKCTWLENAGVDLTIDYKSCDVGELLGEYCPEGVDLYFDNTGGLIMDNVLFHMKDFSKIAGCGMIAHYNDEGISLKNLQMLVTKRILYKGFVCLDHWEIAEEAYKHIIESHSQGRLHYRVDVVDGIENAFSSVKKLFTGENRGKLLIRM